MIAPGAPFCHHGPAPSQPGSGRAGAPPGPGRTSPVPPRAADRSHPADSSVALPARIEGGRLERGGRAGAVVGAQLLGRRSQRPDHIRRRGLLGRPHRRAVLVARNAHGIGQRRREGRPGTAIVDLEGQGLEARQGERGLRRVADQALALVGEVGRRRLDRGTQRRAAGRPPVSTAGGNCCGVRNSSQAAKTSGRNRTDTRTHRQGFPKAPGRWIRHISRCARMAAQAVRGRGGRLDRTPRVTSPPGVNKGGRSAAAAAAGFCAP